MNKILKNTREQTNNYINSVISINRKYGVEEMSQESIAKVKSDVEKASLRLQKLLANSR
ncbi:MAG TPA: hypothetical protein VMQ58_01895 [Candidatus Saccharimonadales bacterium]|nr:hypothetical protein [Candidatus Saccharimonadales bacterium]